MRCTLLILLLCFLPTLSHAQRRSPEGLRLRGRVCDSLTREPLIHAVVQAVSVRDTLYGVTDRNGEFLLRGLRPAYYRITTSFLGYRGAVHELGVQDSVVDAGTLIMTPVEQRIGAVEVRGRMPLMEIAGDTVRYHTAQVKVFENSEALELVRRLPGLTVTDDGSVFHMGQIIDRTLVNNRLIFGRDPRDALKNLPASEVIGVEVYNVKELGSRSLRKYMNLKTRSSFDWNLNMHLLGSIGGDTEPQIDGTRKLRYGAGSEINYFSEPRQLKSNLNFENLNRQSVRLSQLLTVVDRPGDINNDKADISFTNVSPRKFYTRAHYSYANRRVTNETRSERIYFPESDLPGWSYADTSRTQTRRRNHTVGVAVGKEGEHYEAGVGASFSFLRNTSLSRTASGMTDDAGVPQQQVAPRSEQWSDGYSWTIEPSLLYRHRRRSAQTSLKGEITVGWNSGDALQVDTLQQSAVRTNLDIGLRNRSRNIDLELHHSEQLFKDFSMSADYGITDRYEKSYRMAWDRILQQVDTTQSNDYTFDYMTHTGELRFTYFNGFSLNAGLKFQYALQGRDERIGLTGSDRLAFASWLPSFAWQFRKGGSFLSLTYNAQAVLPSCEMVRNRIDARNPLMLQAGNPALRESVDHNLSLWGEQLFPESSVSLSLNVDARIHTDAIVARQQQFRRDTVLEAYGGYHAAAGSLLNSYENAPGGWDLESVFSLGVPLRPLGFHLHFTAQYTHTRAPGYVGERLLYTEGDILRSGLSLRSTFSRRFDLKVFTSATCGLMENGDANRSDYLQWNLSADLKWNFLKRCFLYARYDFRDYHNYDSLVADQQSNRLNVAFGVEFAREKRASVSITVYDLLDDQRNFASKLQSNYLLNSWNNLSGRCIVFNLGYRLNRSGRN